MVPAPVLVFLNTDTVLLPSFATARSALPSPSRSPMDTDLGAAPVVNSILASKELTSIPVPILGKVTTKGVLE